MVPAARFTMDATSLAYSALYVDARFANTAVNPLNLEVGLYVAELSESFMGPQGGWAADLATTRIRTMSFRLEKRLARVYGHCCIGRRGGRETGSVAWSGASSVFASFRFRSPSSERRSVRHTGRHPLGEIVNFALERCLSRRQDGKINYWLGNVRTLICHLPKFAEDNGFALGVLTRHSASGRSRAGRVASAGRGLTSPVGCVNWRCI